MASFFFPLPRTTTATICSSSSLLVTSFKQHLAPNPYSTPPLRLLHLYRVLSLQLSPSDFYAEIRLLARNSITTDQGTSPKVPAPSQGCSTNSPTDNEFTTLLVILLITIRDALPTTYAGYHVNSLKNLLHEQIQDFIINNQVIPICKNSSYHRNGVLGINSTKQY